MRAVDTNVLVRLLTWDNPRQAEAAEAFVRGGVWVSVLALAETIWVLEDIYELTVDQQLIAVESMLNRADLVIQDEVTVRSALENFRAHPALGFSDCLMLEMARYAGH